MATFSTTGPHSDPILDISYLSLRKSIGWIGILMPWVARAVANIRDGRPFLMSISAYYYTPGRDIFVGSLFGAGLFLSFYRGSLNDKQDRILAVIWGIAAAFIALIPMNPCGDPQLACVDPNHQTYHFIPVAVFFAINIYMALFRFTKPSQLPVTPEKQQRNKIYTGCGAVMLASVLAIAYFDHVRQSIFLPEALAIASFGVAWLVKGQMILADKISPRAASSHAAGGA
jgi:hypothetical protein